MQKFVKHNSQRGYFIHELYKEMESNLHLNVICADLGFGMFDHIKDRFPKQFINCGAAENLAVGLAIGATYRGKIPIYYSIASFGFARPFELIRNYVNNESVPIKMVFSGRDKSYKESGFSHWSHDIKPHLDLFTNIKQYWPNNKKEINSEYVKEFLFNGKPSVMILER